MTHQKKSPTPAMLMPAATGCHPTPRDLIQLDLPSDVRVSPTGTHAAISVRTTNWQANRYETVCWLYYLASGKSHPLNRTGSVRQVEWVDHQTLALLKAADGEEKAQVYLYEGMVGEGWAVTAHDCGVEWFMPFANGMLYQANRPDDAVATARTERFGKYIHLEQEPSKNALYYTSLPELRTYALQRRRSTISESKALVPPVVELSRLLPEPLAIRQVLPCPTGKAIYLTCWDRDDLVHYQSERSYCIHLDPAVAVAEEQRRARAEQSASAEQSAEEQRREEQRTQEQPSSHSHEHLGEIEQLPLPAGATVASIAPDGATLLLAYQGRDRKLYTRSDLWLLPRAAATDAAATKAAMQNISAPLDRDLFGTQWTEQGIFAAYVDGTNVQLVRFATDGAATPIELSTITLAGGFHVNPQGHIGLIGASATTLPEAYLARASATDGSWQFHQLTDCGDECAHWHFGTVETIRWQSKDGTEIEGVLRKPANFDPNRQYPLAIVVHGGPRGHSDASLLTHPDRAYYPAVQFANAEMLVLCPNYRGSTGRGQAFTELNVNNLGTGDLWDLESAIDYLDAQGWVDTDRVGCMGWSQGGYISAFAGLHSKRFRAVSVGAGISDWYTYHISNDIPYFTTDYLSGSPFHNREHYPPTAPMSNIGNASTPMLIQHGEDDRRVPLSNAMELYRGLQAMAVPVELFVFPGMGHPINKPRENHAVMCQNLAWFGHYLLGWTLDLAGEPTTEQPQRTPPPQQSAPSST